MSPARQATQQVTGSVYGGGRVTGPSNLAAQLISGTPEFRYEFGAQKMPQQPVAPAQPAPQAVAPAPVEAPAQRVTGEGREQGTPITGDDWAVSRQMTGTEGVWAQGRNPTMRGNPRGSEVGAHVNKALERPEMSTAQITGSSGNYDDGVMITVSGGARG